MKVPLLDLTRQYPCIEKEIQEALTRICSSQRFILGPEVASCEKAIASYCGTRFAIGVSSGTDALILALMTAGVGPGDEVITTPYTFFATAGSIARLGAKPVFVDIEPDTYNLRPDLCAEVISERTKAIIPVHLFGQTADMDPILELARRHNLVVIEDAAQAIGAEYQGRRAGSLGEYGCFSFFPSKNLGAFGDAGMVTTNSPELAEKAVVLRAHGSKPKYHHKMIGGNFRLDTLQAAVIEIKLRHLDNWSSLRQSNARRYQELFKACGLLENECISLPEVRHQRHVFNQYVVRAKDRDSLQKHLKGREIGTEVYYPVPLHLQECFESLGYRQGAFPASERAAAETLALPIFPELTDSEAAFVVSSIAEFYAL